MKCPVPNQYGLPSTFNLGGAMAISREKKYVNAVPLACYLIPPTPLNKIKEDRQRVTYRFLVVIARHTISDRWMICTRSIEVNTILNKSSYHNV